MSRFVGQVGFKPEAIIAERAKVAA